MHRSLQNDASLSGSTAAVELRRLWRIRHYLKRESGMVEGRKKDGWMRVPGRMVADLNFSQRRPAN